MAHSLIRRTFLGMLMSSRMAMFSLVFAELLVAGPVVGGPTPCRWQVATTRERVASDRILELQLPFARKEDGQREFPGPDSIRLIDRNDAHHRPELVLRDMRTGRERPLISSPAFRPEWSPDGRLVACIVSESLKRPRQLVIVDWRSGKIVEAGSSLSVADCKWSPDAKALAVYGDDRTTGDGVLVIAQASNGRTKEVDRTSVIADFDYSWSPDSRLLAYARPARATEHELVLEADLWITDRAGRVRCRVIESTDKVERRPLWVAIRSLALLSAPVNGEHVGDEREVVIELTEKSTSNRTDAVRHP